jgi:hypothetical protein
MDCTTLLIVCDWNDRVILGILSTVKKFVNKHCKILYLMIFILYMYTCMYVCKILYCYCVSIMITDAWNRVCVESLIVV